MSCSALAALLEEVVDRLLRVQPLRVHAGVDHQAHRAPHLVGELAEFEYGSSYSPSSSPSGLGVEAPALDEGREAAVAAEARAARQLLRRARSGGDGRARPRAATAPPSPTSGAISGRRGSRSRCRRGGPSAAGCCSTRWWCRAPNLRGGDHAVRHARELAEELHQLGSMRLEMSR